MTVTSVDKDLDDLTLTLTADFDAPIERVWELWADPRKLERWWGPPEYPATVQEHELAPGGAVRYFMTDSDGQRFPGWWRVTSVDPPTSLAFNDGFAGPDGTPVEDMPVTAVLVRLVEHAGGTRMTVRCAFGSRDEMDRLIEMGTVDGLTQAVGQMDALLASS
jgi:uncharacterized protein YndB with AHSA1/START domain